MGRFRVAVVGDGDRTRAAAQLEAASTSLSVETPASVAETAGADCIVWAAATVDDALAGLADHEVAGPVVLFTDTATPEAIRAAFDGPADDHVRRGDPEQYVLLAHRVERLTAGSTHAETVLGRSASELLGETLWTAFPEARESRFETEYRRAVEWISHELEQQRRRERLQRHRAVAESIDDGVYELDADGTVLYVNRAMCAMTGYDRAELLGEDPSKILSDDSVAAGERAIAAALDAGEDTTSFEVTVQPKATTPIPAEINATILRDDGRFRGTVGVMRDITEQKTYRDRLSELLDASQSLMQARTREEVAEMVTTAARDVLDFEYVGVRLYDSATSTLELVATTGLTDAQCAARGSCAVGEGPAGEVFVSGSAAVYDDVRTSDDEVNRDPVRSAMYFPMGVHGTIAIGTDEPGAIEDIDRQLAALLATSAAAASNRAKREREVREARERIDALVDRVNGLIQDTIEVLVHATTREEIERGVCERLVATEPYDCAWIGRRDIQSDRLTLSATAPEGRFEAAADAPSLAEAVDAGDPSALALERERPQLVDELGTISDSSPIHAQAHDDGEAAVVAIPLTYRDSNYGVLTVYAADADAFEEREQVVLTALGRAIANAINAVERGRILSTDRVIELSLTARDDDLLFGRLSAQAACTLASAGTLQQSDGLLRLYLTSDDADPETLLAVAEDDPDVREARLVVAHEGESLFELAAEDDLVRLLTEVGTLPQELRADDGRVRITVELPYESDAREVFDRVDDRYAQVDLVAYHEHERPVQTRQEFRAAVTERFTDRQETAIRTAYLGGFFEWPRDVDGTELADAMDVSRPTYHQHLRAAQRKVLEELFDPEA